MKEKLELLKSELVKLKEKHEHEWNEPIYAPNLFDGIDNWIYVCKICGKKIISCEKFEDSKLTLKK